MPPRNYDPRRYGPTIGTRVPPAPRDVQSAPAATLRRERDDNLQFAKSLRTLTCTTRAKRAGAGLWSDGQRASDRIGVESHELASSSNSVATSTEEDRFRRPGEARTAPAPRSRVTRTALSKGPDIMTKTKQERFHLHHADLSPFNNTTSTTTAAASFESTTTTADTTAGGASDTAGASPEARGRTRGRSLSWHYRQKATRLQLSPASVYSSSFCLSPAAAQSNSTNNSCTSTSTSTSYEATAVSERVTAQKGRGRRCRGSSRKSGKAREQGATTRGESIDAEELFRRKHKTPAWNVTYGRWVESYDRGMARRASLERRERLEVQRDEDERRQRAEEEFQKWVRNHAPRSACSPSSDVAAATATASCTAAAALGPRSSYHERAASASPLHRQWMRHRQEAWTDGEGEGGDAESKGLGGGSNRHRTNQDKQEEEEERQREREQEEEKRRNKVDRAFRAWLDRKKKQAQAEREAQQRREEALAKLRKLESSRRWKKRPVVCAYTYGAKVGARNWKDEASKKEDGVGQNENEKPKGEGHKKQEEEQEVRDCGDEEGGDGDGLGREGQATDERGRRDSDNSRAGGGVRAEMTEEQDTRAKDEDQGGGDVLQEGGARELKTKNLGRETEDRGPGAGAIVDGIEERAVGEEDMERDEAGAREEHPQKRERGEKNLENIL